MPEHPLLTNNLKKLRKEAGFTQAELASQVSVSRKTINTVENGVFIPSTILALKLAKVLKVSLEEVFQLRSSFN